MITDDSIMMYEKASPKGSVNHKQGWVEVPHFVKHDCIKDVPTLAQEHFLKAFSVDRRKSVHN